MTRQPNVQQLLSDWNRSLPIDGQSGESIVTLADLDRLTQELGRLQPGRDPAPSRRLFQSVASRIMLLLGRHRGTSLPGRPPAAAGKS
jgi:hypothetical protein